jgi:membrane-associated phospholipid phosphatase
MDNIGAKAGTRGPGLPRRSSATDHIGAKAGNLGHITDRLATGYLAFTLAVILLRAGRIPHAPWLFALNASLLLLVRLLAARRSRGGALGVLAEWYPLLFFAIFFEEIGSLVHAFTDGWYDEWLIAADRALFGVDVTVWIEQFVSYWLTEAMQLAYSSYFLLTVGVALYLWFGPGREAFRLLMLASSLAYYACYVIFMLFPIESPYHTMRPLQQVELEGGLVTAVIEWIERYGRVHGGAFPSAHVAGSVVAWLTAWRFAPRIGLWLSPLVVLLMISTVYGRYHYGVDVLAGAIVGVLGFGVAARLSKDRR